MSTSTGSGSQLNSPKVPPGGKPQPYVKHKEDKRLVEDFHRFRQAAETFNLAGLTPPPKHSPKLLNSGHRLLTPHDHISLENIGQFTPRGSRKFSVQTLAFNKAKVNRILNRKAPDRPGEPKTVTQELNRVFLQKQDSLPKDEEGFLKGSPVGSPTLERRTHSPETSTVEKSPFIPKPTPRTTHLEMVEFSGKQVRRCDLDPSHPQYKPAPKPRKATVQVESQSSTPPSRKKTSLSKLSQQEVSSAPNISIADLEGQEETDGVRPKARHLHEIMREHAADCHVSESDLSRAILTPVSQRKNVLLSYLKDSKEKLFPSDESPPSSEDLSSFSEIRDQFSQALNSLTIAKLQRFDESAGPVDGHGYVKDSWDLIKSFGKELQIMDVESVVRPGLDEFIKKLTTGITDFSESVSERKSRNAQREEQRAVPIYEVAPYSKTDALLELLQMADYARKAEQGSLIRRKSKTKQVLETFKGKYKDPGQNTVKKANALKELLKDELEKEAVAMKKKFKAEYKQMLKDGARTERADEAGCEAYAEKSKDGISKMKFHIALSLTMTNPDIWNIIRPDIEPLLQKLTQYSTATYEEVKLLQERGQTYRTDKPKVSSKPSSTNSSPSTRPRVTAADIQIQGDVKKVEGTGNVLKNFSSPENAVLSSEEKAKLYGMSPAQMELLKTLSPKAQPPHSPLVHKREAATTSPLLPSIRSPKLPHSTPSTPDGKKLPRRKPPAPPTASFSTPVKPDKLTLPRLRAMDEALELLKKQPLEVGPFRIPGNQSAARDWCSRRCPEIDTRGNYDRAKPFKPKTKLKEAAAPVGQNETVTLIKVLTQDFGIIDTDNGQLAADFVQDFIKAGNEHTGDDPASNRAALKAKQAVILTYLNKLDPEQKYVLFEFIKLYQNYSCEANKETTMMPTHNMGIAGWKTLFGGTNPCENGNPATIALIDSMKGAVITMMVQNYDIDGKKIFKDLPSIHT